MEISKSLEEIEEELTEVQARVLWQVIQNIRRGIHINDFKGIIFGNEENTAFDEIRDLGLVIVNDDGTVIDWKTKQQEESQDFHQFRPSMDSHWSPRRQRTDIRGIESLTEGEIRNVLDNWPEEPLL